MEKILTVVGTMSGTSFDGVDAAIVQTDGEKIISLGPKYSKPYSKELRENIRSVILGNYNSSDLLLIENELTRHHAEVINELKDKHPEQKIDLVGFHGQTILHDPDKKITWQLANPSLLAKLTGIDVIADFRRGDMAMGGQGAPLVPIFHAALFGFVEKPVAILNLGGVANVTYLGENDDIIAFDTGPACALLDDLVYKVTGKDYDEGGLMAAQGKLDKAVLDKLISHEYFKQTPPKSLDRNVFSYFEIDLPFVDALATLAHFTAATITDSIKYMPSPPKRWIVCGGGRRNKFLMDLLNITYNLPIINSDSFDFDGTYIEAQAFAFLAARSYFGMSTSLATVTGAKGDIRGGGYYRA